MSVIVHWSFKSHVRIEQNDFTGSFAAIVALTDGVNEESVRLKFQERPNEAEILEALAAVIESRNYCEPPTCEELLDRRIAELIRGGVSAEVILETLAEMN